MMISNRRVILRLDGCLEDGFRVSLEVGEEGVLHSASGDGFLPANSGLVDCLAAWQESYRGLAQVTRIQVKQITVQKAPDRSVEDCRRDGRDLERVFQQWLGSEPFRVIDNHLREAVGRQDLVRMVIRTQDRRLHLLPWHTWDFVDRYRAEVGFSLPSRQANEPIALSQFGKVKILAILGHSAGIDTQVDRKLLEGLPDADVEFLVEPDRQQINDQLWEQRWDILFFAGHSLTQDEAGVIHINSGDSLTVAELKYGLRRAIDRGLQLAIFNSCDGLGLAYEIEQMGLSQMVVMRQPVPDSVAQAFLKDLLASFVGGQRFYLAVREAREKLQRFEQKFPCASWLPVIFQNPTQPSLSWEDFRDSRGVNNPPPPAPTLKSSALPRTKLSLRGAICISLLIAILVCGVRAIGWLESSEIKAYDQMVRLLADSKIDDRLLLVTVDERDIKKYEDPLSDLTVKKILQEITSYSPKVVAMDIIRDTPTGKGWKDLLQYLQAENKIIPACILGQTKGVVDPLISFKPPSGVPNSRVAFIDSAMNEKDDSSMVRRYMIHTDQRINSKSCQTDSSLATQAIQSYLPLQIIEMPNGLEISTNSQSITLPMMSPNIGGYHSLTDLHGYQMLVRYKKNRIQRITLEELFSKDSELKDLIQDRIVLLGYSLGDTDYHLTPLGWKYGVEIHAQVISQILDQLTARSNFAALTNAPVTWLPNWLESLLFFAQSLLFGGLMYYIKSKFRWFIMPLAVILISGISIVSFSLSLWLPVIASLVTAILVVVVTGISQILLRQSIAEKS